MQPERILSVTLVLISALVTGCQSTRTLSVAEKNTVQAVYEGGVPILKSVKRDTVIVRLLTPEFSKDVNALPAFFVAVANGGTGAFDFSTSNITATCGSAPVRVYTAADVQKRIEHEAAMLAFATALNGASQSMQASMPQQTYTSGYASAYGSGGYANANYYGTSTTYNPAATAAAQAQINANTSQQMATIAGLRNAQLNGLGSMLKRETIAPGAFAGGVVKLHAEDIRNGQIVTLHVQTGSEVHDFLFAVGR
jgi:hypothetical protein